MSIAWIDADRLDELTEWCRNKPEEAARRILCAEGAGDIRRGPDLIDRQRVDWRPRGFAQREKVELVGGPYNGEVIFVSDKEGVIRLDGLVYGVQVVKWGYGPVRPSGYAHYSGTTVR